MTRNIILVCLILFSNLIDLKAQNASFSPPIPLYPKNGDSLLTLTPIFTWSPLYPITNYSNPKYTIHIVEILDGQSAEAAILSNVDWYVAKDIENTFLNYPISAPSFQVEKRYAWQIEVEFKPTSGGEKYTLDKLVSEVVSFNLGKGIQMQVCNLTLVTNPNQKLYVISDNQIRFSIDSPIKEKIDEVTLSILDVNNNPLPDNPVNYKTVSKGIYLIELASMSTFRKRSSHNKFYSLMATSKTGEKYSLKFTTK